jgi:hypothetical protein
MSMRSAFAALVLVTLAACHVMRPSELPLDAEWIAAVKSCRMPEGEPTITHFAHHSWIDLKRGDERSWRRIEITSETSGVRSTDIRPAAARRDVRWGEREVRVLACVSGPNARSVVEQIEQRAGELSQRYADDYIAWPGPNSNTLIADIARSVPGLSVQMHHNAVGKDYPGWIEAGLTSSRTGVHLDTLPLGVALGLREGIELHFLQLTFGLSFWPPRLELPFLPELPWSDRVDYVEHEPPPGTCFVLLFDGGSMTSTGGAEGIDPHSTWRLAAADSDEWVWLEHAPLENGALQELEVREKRYDGEDEIDSTRTVSFVDGRAVLFEGDLEGQRIVIVLEQLPSGQLLPHVDVAPSDS